MSVQVGDIAPDFEQDTANGSIRFHEWLGRSWCLLISQPVHAEPAGDPAAIARTRAVLAGHEVKLLGLTTEPSDAHFGASFPIVVDVDGSVSTLYGVGDRAGHALLIDPNKRLRLKCSYVSGAFDFEEMVGLVRSLQQQADPIGLRH